MLMIALVGERGSNKAIGRIAKLFKRGNGRCVRFFFLAKQFGLRCPVCSAALNGGGGLLGLRAATEILPRHSAANSDRPVEIPPIVTYEPGHSLHPCVCAAVRPVSMVIGVWI
jgi:hypothetical protein